MSLDFGNRLDQALRLPVEERVGSLVALGNDVLQANGTADRSLRDRLVTTLAEVVGEGVGTPKDRLAAGEVLGWLGDPRLHRPSDADYWARVDGVSLGRFPVTNEEFRVWARDGGYEDRASWSAEGWAWLQSCPDPWKTIAGEENKRFLVPNQPVVGVTWWEAEAHARGVGARLPTSDERLLAVRGPQKRPYPWGEPFGSGNANTREEVLNRPCAVGLFVRDRTPEGIYDLAGNVGEWLADEVGQATSSGSRKMQALRFVHPGAWNQPSMASWAKAKDLRAPDDRSAGIGFRLARD